MPATVLVVEKNPKIGALVSGQLREKGYDASDVRHGAEVASVLRQKSCDVILMDNQVPMGGVKTARILRLHPKYCTIPVILSLPTNKVEARDIIAEAQQHGVSHFLFKPFTMSTLQKKMDEVIESGEKPDSPTFQDIRDEIRSLTNLPAMPAAHSKLLSLLSKADAEVDMNEVSRTLETDPALAARVMRTCRSAYFGFQGSLMKQAVAFLGAAVIRKVVQSSILSEMFKEESAQGEGNLTMEGLWRHSLAVGMAMEVIGKEDKKKTHFILGVMHDIGKAVFMYRFTEHFAKVQEMVAEENVSIIEAESEILGITHADCGAELAVHWDMPGEVRTAIGAHHHPGSSSQHKRLAAMVHISDIAVRTMKIGFAGDNLIPPMDPYAKRLQKSVEEITKHREDFISQIDSMIGGQSDESEE